MWFLLSFYYLPIPKRGHFEVMFVDEKIVTHFYVVRYERIVTAVTIGRPKKDVFVHKI
jgi:hypothetical protein